MTGQVIVRGEEEEEEAVGGAEVAE